MTDGTGLDIVGSLLPALAIVVGIPLGVWWWLRRGGKVGVTPGVRVTAKAGLGRNTFVAVVSADQRRCLVVARDFHLRAHVVVAENQRSQLAEVLVTTGVVRVHVSIDEKTDWAVR